MVTGLAATDGVLVVQYGRHDPTERDAYQTVSATADIYDRDGKKLVENLDLRQRLLAGGDHLYLLESEPPVGWTISVREWVGANLPTRAD